MAHTLCNVWASFFQIKSYPPKMKYTPGRQHREKPASRAVKKFSGLRKCPENFFYFPLRSTLDPVCSLCARRPTEIAAADFGKAGNVDFGRIQL